MNHNLENIKQLQKELYQINLKIYEESRQSTNSQSNKTLLELAQKRFKEVLTPLSPIYLENLKSTYLEGVKSGFTRGSLYKLGLPIFFEPKLKKQESTYCFEFQDSFEVTHQIPITNPDHSDLLDVFQKQTTEGQLFFDFPLTYLIWQSDPIMNDVIKTIQTSFEQNTKNAQYFTQRILCFIGTRMPQQILKKPSFFVEFPIKKSLETEIEKLKKMGKENLINQVKNNPKLVIELSPQKQNLNFNPDEPTLFNLSYLFEKKRLMKPQHILVDKKTGLLVTHFSNLQIKTQMTESEKEASSSGVPQKPSMKSKKTLKKKNSPIPQGPRKSIDPSSASADQGKAFFDSLNLKDYEYVLNNKFGFDSFVLNSIGLAFTQGLIDSAEHQELLTDFLKSSSLGEEGIQNHQMLAVAQDLASTLDQNSNAIFQDSYQYLTNLSDEYEKQPPPTGGAGFDIQSAEKEKLNQLPNQASLGNSLDPGIMSPSFNEAIDEIEEFEETEE
jgi:hypothetical protein